MVRLYYLEDRTLAEIGRMLGVTESRICQLHGRLVARLRVRGLAARSVRLRRVTSRPATGRAPAAGGRAAA